MTAIILEADGARATIHPSRGALLTELKLRTANGRSADVLWMPSDFKDTGSGWPRGGCPVLFPFAGRVWHEDQPFHYRWDGVVRNMPIHGFAYALPWQVTSHSKEQTTLTLVSDAKTRDLYPFHFFLELVYTLFPDRMRCTLTMSHVEQQGVEPLMPISPGFHPYFRLPRSDASPISNFGLETSATAAFQVTPAGAAGKHQELSDAPPLPLAKKLYQNLILTKMTNPSACLRDETGEHQVKLLWSSLEDLRHLVLWTTSPDDYICVEPWMGLPNAVTTGAGLAKIPAGHCRKIWFEIGV